jgi:hypothetical protein
MARKTAASGETAGNSRGMDGGSGSDKWICGFDTGEAISHARIWDEEGKRDKSDKITVDNDY